MMGIRTISSSRQRTARAPVLYIIPPRRLTFRLSMRLISSIAFVLIATVALAQHAAPRQPAAPKKDKAPAATATPEKDTVKVKKDPRRFIPTGVRVGTDGLTIAR